MLLEQLTAFMDEHVYAAEPVYARQLAASDDQHTSPPILGELQQLAREQGLWNLFLPDERFGAGLTNAEYAPLAEAMGRSLIGAEIFNCSAPDTGNIELLVEYGSEEQQTRWLEPLLEGEIRSCFGMTEPGVASSDPTNISTRVELDGDELVVTGSKWWTTGAASADCKLCIVMAVSAPEADPRGRHSMVLVPLDSSGVEIKRTLPVFGYDIGHGGHCEIEFKAVRVPVASFLGACGEGFQMAQARLGPGRIHHCMRLIGMAERSLELLCLRSLERETFGKPLARQGVVREWIADSRIEIDQARLLVLRAAALMDVAGNRAARGEISEIKVAVPAMACRVIDRAIQAFGGEGVSNDVPLAAMYAAARTLRIADGPDEVHKLSVARRELARYLPGG